VQLPRPRSRRLRHLVEDRPAHTFPVVMSAPFALHSHEAWSTAICLVCGDPVGGGVVLIVVVTSGDLPPSPWGTLPSQTWLVHQEHSWPSADTMIDLAHGRVMPDCGCPARQIVADHEEMTHGPIN
jgi:hypothetical protein